MANVWMRIMMIIVCISAFSCATLQNNNATNFRKHSATTAGKDIGLVVNADIVTVEKLRK